MEIFVLENQGQSKVIYATHNKNQHFTFLVGKMVMNRQNLGLSRIL
jgi:hypothetical protein